MLGNNSNHHTEKEIEVKNVSVRDSSNKTFFLAKPVKKSSKVIIRERFDTLLQDHKLKWVEIYGKVGLSKSHASMIRNGHIIPPNYLRIKIASAIGCDSTCLWKAPDIISADKINLREQKNG